MLGDGHTALRGGLDVLSGYFPLRLSVYEDGLFVRAAAPAYSTAVGARVVAINGTAAHEALSLALTITHGDNLMSKQQFGAELLTVPALLRGLGIVPASEAARLTLEDENGMRLTISPSPVSFDAAIEWVDARAAASPTPLFLQHAQSPFWWTFLRESRTVYVQLNVVRDGPEETVADFFQRVLEFTDEHALDRFVLDIRLNGGGNKRLNQPILEGLLARPHLNRHGKLFVLIGRRTFSAAVHLATQLKRFSNRPCTTWGGRGTSARTDAGGPMRAYSMDLRERALLDSDAGMKAADVAAKYRVSGSWVRLLKQRRRDTGEVAPRVQRQGRRGMREPHLHTVAALLAAHPDRTLAELKDALATPASVPTVWRAVRALGLTVKKNGPPVRTRSA